MESKNKRKKKIALIMRQLLVTLATWQTDTHQVEPPSNLCTLTSNRQLGRKRRKPAPHRQLVWRRHLHCSLPHSASDQFYIQTDTYIYKEKTATFKCNLRQRLNNFRLSNADWLPREKDKRERREREKESTLGSCARHAASFSPGLASIVC